MGELYLAEDTPLHRKVAIKLLPPKSASDEQARKRLIREARAAAQLDHPNICAIHEVGEDAKVKVLDFGLAKKTYQKRPSSLPKNRLRATNRYNGARTALTHAQSIADQNDSKLRTLAC